MGGYRHLLLAVDFSPDTEKVAARAVDLAQRYGAQVSLLHVIEQIPVDPANDLVIPEQVLLDDQLMNTARDSLRELAQRFGIPDAPQYVELGSTKTEIIRVAKELQVDLIVVGSHGRHGLALLLGSTANAVLHAAPCDVLAVRIKD
ncbi:MAG: universal stress protein [Gammaproteobacteria bacterium]